MMMPRWRRLQWQQEALSEEGLKCAAKSTFQLPCMDSTDEKPQDPAIQQLMAGEASRATVEGQFGGPFKKGCTERTQRRSS